MVEVGGTPMVVRRILALKTAGIREFVINTAHGSGLLEAMLGDGSQWGVHIRFSHEGECSAEALETLGGIAKALPMLTDRAEESFIVTAGDLVTDYPWQRLLKRGEHLGELGLDAHLVLVPNPSYHPEGDMGLTEDSQVTRATRTYTFASFGVYRAELFQNIKPVRAKLFPWLWQSVDAGRVSGELYKGLWLNVGDFDELERAEEELSKRKSSSSGAKLPSSRLE